jgi:hypothetical protein
MRSILVIFTAVTFIAELSQAIVQDRCGLHGSFKPVSSRCEVHSFTAEAIQSLPSVIVSFTSDSLSKICHLMPDFSFSITLAKAVTPALIFCEVIIDSLNLNSFSDLKFLIICRSK